MKTYEEILSSISALNFGPTGKYASKLDFDQRCEILALYRTGVGRAALAAAYKLDRRTITHIYNPQSPHYRNVREEERKLGTEQFMRKYITENGLSRLKGVTPAPSEGPKVTKLMPRRQATSKSGVHVVKTDATSYEHRIQIGWRENGVDSAGAGWYYRDADGADPEAWLHNGDDSRVTSKACYEAVLENLVDV